MTVPLPEQGDGRRRRRRAARRRRGWRLVASAVGVVFGLAVLGGLAWTVAGLFDGDDDDGSPRAGDDVSRTGGPGPALAVLTDDAGRLYGITLLVPAADTIVHVPPGTLVEVPSLGLASLQEAAEAGGDDLLRQSLENLLGARLDEVIDVDPARLAAMLTDAGPLDVAVADPVQARSASGRVEVLIPSGSFTILPENALGFLEPVGDGSALERIVRHQLFWSAYLAAVDDTQSDAVAALSGVDARHRVLPVEVVSEVEGEELYRVDADGLDELVRRVLPDAAPPDGTRIRVRILNGAGTPGLAQEVQPLLVDIGAEVTLSGNADRFDYATTQVVYYEDEDLESARAVAEALGVGEVVKSRTPLAVVDVTVVVGADFLAAHPGGTP
ncbi:MAG TPA: LCP family protein [Acidimicrobiales bacterium]|nr:LCP family protein [Acidimicrobiales bacterium]